MVDWNLRLVMHRVWGDCPAVPPWRSTPRRRRSSWPSGGAEIDVLDVEPDAYVELLARRLEAAHEYQVAARAAAFEDSELDALYFFGRERDTEIVVANLIASRFTVLYGPSGVGKSSLLLAAVARALRGLPEPPVVIVFSSWSDDPARALAAALAGLAGVEGGELLDVAERAQEDRDVYVILDQQRSTSRTTATGGLSGTAELVNRRCESTCSSLRADTLRVSIVSSSIPNLFANVLRLDRPIGRGRGDLRPLERWRS
jgi:hypothetical protein